MPNTPCINRSCSHIDVSEHPAGHICPQPGSSETRICLASEDDLIYPWRDLYPLAGQRVLWEGEEWTVLAKSIGGEMLKLFRTEMWPSGAEIDLTAKVLREECRPLGWTMLDELCLDLQAAADSTGIDVAVIVMEV